MSEASFASLNPTLLARKGGAKPAMRPQLTNLPDAADPEKLEDLGWNDMGQDDEADSKQQTAEVVHLTPANAGSVEADQGDDADEHEEPMVLRQQEDLAKRVSQKNAKRKSAVSQGRRAAFTLRLDTERHLKLRLAATMQDKSAQAIVTEALDALLEEIDDLDSLAQRMKRT